jgi:hypothetical protein
MLALACGMLLLGTATAFAAESGKAPSRSSFSFSSSR